MIGAYGANIKRAAPASYWRDQADLALRPLKKGAMELLRDNDRWESFEELVRNIVVNALRTAPSDQDDRRSYLPRLSNLPTERAPKKCDRNSRG